MALGDIYQIRDVQDLFSQHVENVYFYRQALEFVSTNPTAAQSLAEAWLAQMLPLVTDIQTPDVTHTSITVTNLYDDGDGYELSISEPGTLTGGSSTGQALGAFEALAFQLDGTNHAVKNGQKRIAGVDEAWDLDGVLDPSYADTVRLQDAADGMAAPIQIGTIITDPVFVPVTVKRVRSGAPGSYTYRLPANSGEGVWSAIVVGLFKFLITSQISRKIGVGI